MTKEIRDILDLFIKAAFTVFFIYGVLCATGFYNQNETPDIYYMQAEAIYTDASGTVFGRVDSNHTYRYEKSTYMRNDIPYILTMDSNGTEDISDDSILCVWQLVE